MKKSIGFVLLGVLLVFFGSACGGGGGGTTSTDSTSGTDGDTLSNVQLVGVLQGTNVGVGLTDLAAGDVVQLKFVGTDSTGHQVARDGAGFSTTAPSSVATVSPEGLLTVSGTSSSVFTVSGSGPAGSQSRDLKVTTFNTFVSGRIRNLNGTGVANVKVLFYSASGTLQATGSSGPTGSFRAAVPASSAGFTIDIEQADPPTGAQYYYREFAYGSKYYLNDADCPVPVPALTEGSSVDLPAQVVLADRSSGPPPPPSGCLAG